MRGLISSFREESPSTALTQYLRKAAIMTGTVHGEFSQVWAMHVVVLNGGAISGPRLLVLRAEYLWMGL